MTTKEEKIYNCIYYTYYSYEESEDGRGYIGSRKCPSNKTPQTDPYLGSYKDKTFKPTNKTILSIHSSLEEAIAMEHSLHIVYNVDRNPLFANCSKQRTAFPYFQVSSLGKKAYNDGTREIRLLPHEEVPEGFELGGVSRISEELRKFNSERNKNSFWINNGIKNKFILKGTEIPEGYELGITPPSDETKQKIRESLRSRKVITNGESVVILNSKEEIPEGFVEYLTYDEYRLEQKYTFRGKKWIHNGTKQLLIDALERVPEGFTIGKLDSYIPKRSQYYNEDGEIIILYDCEEVPDGLKHGTPDHIKLALSEANKGSFRINDGFEEKLLKKDDEIPEGWSKGGLSLSEERKQQISSTQKGQIWINNGEIEKIIKRDEEIPNGWTKGYLPNHITPEAFKVACKGTVWCNNGTKNKRVKTIEDIPEGYVKGRIPPSEKTKARRSEIATGAHYYNNGTVCKLLKEENGIPEGFVKGKLQRK